MLIIKILHSLLEISLKTESSCKLDTNEDLPELFSPNITIFWWEIYLSLIDIIK